jgi:hypothetical protein
VRQNRHCVRETTILELFTIPRDGPTCFHGRSKNICLWALVVTDFGSVFSIKYRHDYGRFLGNAGELSERSSHRAEISNVYRAEPIRTADLYRVNSLGDLGTDEVE